MSASDVAQYPTGRTFRSSNNITGITKRNRNGIDCAIRFIGAAAIIERVVQLRVCTLGHSLTFTGYNIFNLTIGARRRSGRR